MTSEVQDAERNQLSGQQAPERRAWFLPGIRMLVLGLAGLIVGVAPLWPAVSAATLRQPWYGSAPSSLWPAPCCCGASPLSCPAARM